MWYKDAGLRAECGRGGIGIHNRLKSLSAPVEMPGVELLKFGETLTGRADGNPEPSPMLRIKVIGKV